MHTLWVSLSFAAALVCANTRGQDRTVPTGLQIAQTARTNLQAALDLADKAVAGDPANAQPLLWRAQLLDQARRYNDGIRDLTAAFKLSPDAPVPLQRRGELNFKAGHFKDSVADFDRVIQLAPNQAAHHWQRGISLYYANRFAEARRQFELHQTVNTDDVENAAWHFLCAARETGITNARALMLTVGPDQRVPMKQIEQLYRGSGTAENVLAAAQRAARENGDRNALFYAHLYLGLYFHVLGDATRAREHAIKAASDLSANHYMGDVARVHLRSLGK